MSKEGVEEKITGFSWAQLLTMAVLLVAVPIIWTSWIFPYIQAAKNKLTPAA